jgi:SAM-dependent methyltransferase
LANFSIILEKSKNREAKMSTKQEDEIRTVVRNRYGEIAERDPGGCGCATSPSCCGAPIASMEDYSAHMGYSVEQLRGVPQGADMGLGCGNPQAIAALKPAETALDLGSGGGFDCFLAAKQVGETGKVIGVDMTPEMIGKARENARKGGYSNVEFRLGEIEHLPVADGSVDVIISNCVVNLSPDKLSVFREAFRTLKPGGRLAVMDVVATAPLPPELKDDLDLLSACVAGAVTIEEIEDVLRTVGFQDIRISPLDESRAVIEEWVPGRNVEDYVLSASIEATKPK